MFNNVKNTQREVRNGLTFPAVALLSSHCGCSTSSLLRSAQRALCLMSTLLNGSLLSELSAQQTLCSDLLSELSAQQTLCSVSILLNKLFDH